ncbi:Retrovirus-related Pol polyprotein from transposon RE1 [Linum perenne]
MAPPNFLSFAASASSTTTQTLHLPPSSIRLDRDNFTLWRTMVISTLEAFELDSHIRADTHPAETRMISNEGGTVTSEPNPEFLTWKRRDRFVLLWLKSTLSDTILASVARTTTCYSTWQSLNTTFQSQTKAHRMVLKSQLQTLQKGALSMLDYVEKKRAIADCLAENLHPISDEDLIGYILAGLDSSYGSFKSAFMMKADDLTVDHLIGYLLQEEARLERDLTRDAPLMPTPPASSLPTALTANRFNPHRSHSAGRRSSSSGSSVAARYSSPRSAPRSGPPSSFNRPGEARSPTVICQLCGRANHEAIDCWQRSNLIDYPSRRPPPQRDNHRQAHVAQYGGSSSMVVDPAWYFDTGATDHVTPDISKLTVTEDYGGNDKLQVGNGSSSSSRGHP